MTARYDRRAFLRRAGTASAAGALAPLFVRDPAAAQADPSLGPFAHGVASGDPLPDGVVLWTRVSGHDEPVEVRWQVARDVGMADVVASGTATASAERDHTVKVDVRGLDPGQWYFYRFEAAGACSLTGRTKTAPAGDIDRLRFAVVSCSSYQHGYFNSYAALAERDDLDAVIHLGDYIYEYAPSGYSAAAGALDAPRRHDPPHEIVTLADYRTRHSQYKLDQDLRRLHQLFPFITTWDDHESTNDSWRDGAENHQRSEGSWAERKAAAQRAYEEWMPIRVADPSRIYRSLRYGDLADLIVLDTRLDGRDRQLGSQATVILEDGVRDPQRQLVSPEQRRFWFDEMTASARRGTRWRIIGQQVMMAPLNLVGLPNVERLLGLDLPDLPLFLLSGPAAALNPDQWDGYVAERDRFYDHVLDDGIDNVVVLTGDIHTAWASNLSTDPYSLLGRRVGVEFVTTSVTSPGFEEILGSEELANAAASLLPVVNPHMRYVNLVDRGYLVLDVTAERVRADFHVVPTVRRRSPVSHLVASWQVLDGENALSEPRIGPTPGHAAPATPGAEVCAPAAATPPSGRDDGPVTAAASTRATLPATGGGGALVGGAALLGAAGLAQVVRRRSQVGSPEAPTSSS